MIRPAIQRYAASMVAWIPDLSEFPARKRLLIGIAASILLHAVFLGVILLALELGNLLPKIDAETPPPPREIELTVSPPEPPPEPILPMAPNPQRRFLDQTGLDISKVAPDHPDFESNENGIAASDLPAKGDIPLPSQEGRDLPAQAFKSQRALFGKAPEPFPADPQTTSLATPPPDPTPPPAEQDVALTPAPDTPPQPPQPEKAQKEPPPATPPPAATPPPRAVEKTETPDIAKATPPPVKVVDKPAEDEVAIASKPAATPPPSAAQTQQPQPSPAPTPMPRVAVQTPKPVQQVKLYTPAPRVQPSAQSSNQLEQEQNHIEGNISNRHGRSANTVATPLGKYRKQIIDAIGSRWQYYVKAHSDVIALGSAQVSFLVDNTGHVRAVRMESNTSNQSFADICERAIREAEIPEPPAEAIAPMRDGHLEISINFTLYSL